MNRKPLWPLCAAFVALGSLGYALNERADVFAAIAVLATHAALWCGCWAITRHDSPGEPRLLAERVLITMVCYFSVAITIGFLLGLVGALNGWVFELVVAAVALTLCAFETRPNPASHAPIPAGQPAQLIRLLQLTVLIVVVWIAARCLFDPEYVYDTMLYHLYFPAKWVQAGRIVRVATWCGGAAVDYYPLGTETYHATLMLPAGSDLIARCGQFPFWLTMLLGVLCLARRLGLSEIAAWSATLGTALLPGPAMQAYTGMVDVAMMSHLLALVFFIIRAGREKPRSNITFVILTTGLLAGAKFMALGCLATTGPLLIWMILRRRQSEIGEGGRLRPGQSCDDIAEQHRLGPRRNFCTAFIVMLAITSGPAWYIWNWLETGNPMYPIEVRVAGHTVFAGTMGTEQVRNSPYNPRLEFGGEGVARIAWQGFQAWAVRDGAASPSQSRRTRAMLVLSVLGLLTAAGMIRWAARRRQLERALVAGTVLLLIAYLYYVVPILHARFIWSPIVLSVVVIASLLDVRGIPGKVVGVAMGAIWLLNVVPVFAQVVIGDPSRLINASEVRSRDTVPSRALMGQAWAWIDKEARGSRLAYAGNNIPYFLMGRRFENRVDYFPARRPAPRRYHEAAALPDVKSLGRPNTWETVPDRFRMDPAAWLENLRQGSVERVVVNSMKGLPSLLVNIRHDAEGFPVERAWLDDIVQRGGAERLEFDRGLVKVYRLKWNEACNLKGQSVIVQDEVDALDALRRMTSASSLIPNYPLARPFIEKSRLEALSMSQR